MKASFILLSICIALGVYSLQSKASKQLPINITTTKVASQALAPKALKTTPPTAVTIKTLEAKVVPSVIRIQNLSQVALKNKEQIASLNELLNDPDLPRQISEILNDSENFSGAKFQLKLRLLDSLYEGLKSEDVSVNAKYIGLATSLLIEPASREIAQNARLSHEFLADRTEIAIALLKAFPSQAQEIEQQVESQSPTGLAAFRNARRLMNNYQVAI